MKKMVVLWLLAAAPMLSGAVGDSLPAEALPTRVIQGEAVPAWEPGTTYLFECWATWCGPCLSAMPHLEAIWQEVKDEKIRVIGLNLRDNRTPAELRTFLETFRRGPVTYTNLQITDDALPKRLGIVGIPYAFAVRNGTVIWDGHPMRLTAEDLRALHAGKSGEAVQEAAAERLQQVVRARAKEVPLALRLERKADAAAAAGDWAVAAALQREALSEHPLAFRVTGEFDPAAEPEPEVPGAPAPETVSSTGELAPYAALLGRDLPDDSVFTFISCWRPDPFLKGYSASNLSAFPGERERAILPYAHRVITVTDVSHRAVAEQQFAAVPMLRPEVIYLPPFDAGTLFGFEDSQRSPAVALFKSGRLLYKGPLDLLPEALKRETKCSEDPSAEELLEAIAREREANELLLERFRAFRKLTGEAAERERAALCRDVPIAAWETILLPYRFGSVYQAQDVPGAKRLAEELFARYANSEAALDSLGKLTQSWPELLAATYPLQSRIAERLAQIHTRARRDYTVAYYEQAANFAREAGDSVREQQMLTRALQASPAAKRLRDILRKKQPLPSE